MANNNAKYDDPLMSEADAKKLGNSLLELSEQCFDTATTEISKWDEILKKIETLLDNHPNSEVKESIQLDEMVKSLLELSPNCILGVINKCFNTNYDPKKTNITYLSNTLIDPNKNFVKTETDILIEINKQVYHLEIQTLNDTSMITRLLQYGIDIGIKKYNANPKSNFEMPLQAAIFLEKNDKIVDQELTIFVPNKRNWEYDANTIRFWRYSIEDLINEKMYCLLPLVIFNYRKIFRSILTSKRKNKLNDLAREEDNARKMAKKIASEIRKLYDDNVIVYGDMHVMLLVLTNLSQYLSRKFLQNSLLEEGVFDMIKTLYDPVLAKKSMEEGIEIGEKRGEIRGEIKVMYIDMKMNTKEISKKLKIPVEKVEDVIKNELNL